MTSSDDLRPTPSGTPRARDQRRARNDLRAAGAAIVMRAKLHLLGAMRATPRCAPWRSGRTLKDLERRSGLAALASPQHAPLAAALIELLVADGVVLRRAGHYRLAAACALRCPSCAGTTFARRPPPTPPDDALEPCDRFVCETCGAWCGLALPAPPPAPSRPRRPAARGPAS